MSNGNEYQSEYKRVYTERLDHHENVAFRDIVACLLNDEAAA